MIAIVCADNHWGIGYRNQQLVSIPSSQRLLREKTSGQVVVMGRKTWEALPYGQLLQGSTKLVLSRDPGYQRRGVTVLHGRLFLLKALKAYEGHEVYVAGGAEIYRLLLPHCDTVLVTKVDAVYQADAFFPDLDESPEWELTEEGEEQTCFDIEFRFLTYKRRSRT